MSTSAGVSGGGEGGKKEGSPAEEGDEVHPEVKRMATRALAILGENELVRQAIGRRPMVGLVSKLNSCDPSLERRRGFNQLNKIIGRNKPVSKMCLSKIQKSQSLPRRSDEGCASCAWTAAVFAGQPRCRCCGGWRRGRPTHTFVHSRLFVRSVPGTRLRSVVHSFVRSLARLGGLKPRYTCAVQVHGVQTLVGW